MRRSCARKCGDLVRCRIVWSGVRRLWLFSVESEIELFYVCVCGERDLR